MKNLKKIELHVHLDGSMSLELASKLANLPISVLKEKMLAPSKSLNLKDYLTKFTFPLSLMQTRENLELVARDLVKQLENDHVIYAEIRFAPFFHTKEGLSLEEVIESVLKGLKNEKVKTNLILCLMRGLEKEKNLQVIEVAKKYLKKGVVALDLAGDEKQYPLKNYLNLLKIVQKENIPLTVHAGETGLSDLKDILKLDVKRIGHGVFSIYDENILKEIKNKNILLEICPTSNIQTNAFKIYQDHPILKLYQKNIDIAINTDNRTVSNITLNQEYQKLNKYFSFQKADFDRINRNAINYTFLSSKEKIDLLEEFLKND